MELRQHVRHRVRFRSTFSSRDMVSGEGTLVDLSVRGGRISSQTKVTNGTELDLWLYLPSQDRDSPVEIQQAVVRWTKKEKGEFGVQFLQLEGKTPEQIRSFIKTLIPII
jgi:hypothetical protein